MDEIDDEQDAPIIIAGFGRYGQIVGRLLNANGLSATVLDHDADRSRRCAASATRCSTATRPGSTCCARPARRAHACSCSRSTTSDTAWPSRGWRASTSRTWSWWRARATSTHYYRLRERGVHFIERETLDSALMSARSVLELMGWQPHSARNQAMRFRRHNIELMQRMALHAGDQKQLIALAKLGRAQLEAQWAEERRHNRQRDARAGWHAPLEGRDATRDDGDA